MFTEKLKLNMTFHSWRLIIDYRCFYRYIVHPEHIIQSVEVSLSLYCTQSVEVSLSLYCTNCFLTKYFIPAFQSSFLQFYVAHFYIVFTFRKESWKCWGFVCHAHYEERISGNATFGTRIFEELKWRAISRCIRRIAKSDS